MFHYHPPVWDSRSIKNNREPIVEQILGFEGYFILSSSKKMLCFSWLKECFQKMEDADLEVVVDPVLATTIIRYSNSKNALVSSSPIPLFPPVMSTVFSFLLIFHFKSPTYLIRIFFCMFIKPLIYCKSIQSVTTVALKYLFPTLYIVISFK